ncbi:MAG: phasin family protein [Proteobacteria bacterium]|nr:phasin family protein [Pseudomonadota bacterium]
MAKKKTLKKKVSSDKKQSKLAETLVGSANEIWLAGLGAFAKAQTEGKKIYDKLIDEGKDFEKLFKSVPQKAVNDVKSTVTTTVSSAKKRASESWDKLEGVFEKRVEKSLKSLGVPTSKEISNLVARIESLTAEVKKLSSASNKAPVAKKAPVKKAPAKKLVPKKPVVKKPVVKKPVVKKAVTKKVATKKAQEKKKVTKK